MSKLLRANFSRLWKSRVFWAGMIFSFGAGALYSLGMYRDMLRMPGYHPHIDSVLFANNILIIFTAAVFTGLFIGTEYSDGTIRNEIIAGRARPEIYLSNFLVCLSAHVLMNLASIAAVVLVGFPLVGNIDMSALAIFVLELTSIAALAALGAIFLLIVMLVHSKAGSSVAVLLLAIVFFLGAMVMNSKLNEPEYYDSYNVMVTGDEAEVQDGYAEKTKNPYYPRGIKRKVYQFLYDFLPGCQLLQTAAWYPEQPEKLILYSFSITAAATVCGVFFFTRKNIR